MSSFNGYENSKGEKIEVSYVKCKNCDYRFFTCKEDKEKYLRLIDAEKSQRKNFTNALLKGYLKNKSEKKK